MFIDAGADGSRDGSFDARADSVGDVAFEGSTVDAQAEPVDGAISADGDAPRDAGTGDVEVIDAQDDSCSVRTFFRDRDRDGFGDVSQPMSACDPPAGYVTSNDDCDDDAMQRYPGATEMCNGDDEDCDRMRDEDFACVRGMSSSCPTVCLTIGSRVCSETCEIPSTCTPPSESCNGMDDDCDLLADEGARTTPAGGITGAQEIRIPFQSTARVLRADGLWAIGTDDATGAPVTPPPVAPEIPGPLSAADGVRVGEGLVVAWLDSSRSVLGLSYVGPDGNASAEVPGVIERGRVRIAARDNVVNYALLAIVSASSGLVAANVTFRPGRTSGGTPFPPTFTVGSTPTRRYTAITSAAVDVVDAAAGFSVFYADGGISELPISVAGVPGSVLPIVAPGAGMFTDLATENVSIEGSLFALIAASHSTRGSMIVRASTRETLTLGGTVTVAPTHMAPGGRIELAQEGDAILVVSGGTDIVLYEAWLPRWMTTGVVIDSTTVASSVPNVASVAVGSTARVGVVPVVAYATSGIGNFHAWRCP